MEAQTKVADKSTLRRILLFDGLLIAMLGWLLWSLYSSDAKAVEQEAVIEVEAPAFGGAQDAQANVDAALDAGSADAGSEE